MVLLQVWCRSVVVLVVLHDFFPPCFHACFVLVDFLFVGRGQIDIRDRDDNKEVSLSTSKINYMDPRVSVAWCKRHEAPMEKVSGVGYASREQAFLPHAGVPCLHRGYCCRRRVGSCLVGCDEGGNSPGLLLAAVAVTVFLFFLCSFSN